MKFKHFPAAPKSQHRHGGQPQPVFEPIVPVPPYNLLGEPLDCTRSSVEVCKL